MKCSRGGKSRWREEHKLSGQGGEDVSSNYFLADVNRNAVSGRRVGEKEKLASDSKIIGRCIQAHWAMGGIQVRVCHNP